MSNNFFTADTAYTLLCFLWAGTLQISGAYFLKEWMRGAKPLSIGLTGGAMIIAAALALTIVPGNMGRAYTAYAGALALFAVVWGWHYTGVKIDLIDVAGVALIIGGVCIVVLTPRK